MKLSVSTSLRTFTAFLMLGVALRVQVLADGDDLAKEALEIAQLQAMLAKKVGALNYSDKRVYDSSLQARASLIEDSGTRQGVLDDIQGSFNKDDKVYQSREFPDDKGGLGFDEDEEEEEGFSQGSSWGSSMSSLPDNTGWNSSSSQGNSFSSPPDRGGGVQSSYVSSSQGSGWGPPISSSPRGGGVMMPGSSSSGWSASSSQGNSFSPPPDRGSMQSSYVNSSQGSSWGTSPSISSDSGYGQDMSFGGSYNSAGGMSSNPMSEWANERPEVYGGGYDSSVEMPSNSGYEQNMSFGGSYNSAGGMSSDSVSEWGNERPVNEAYGGGYDSSIEMPLDSGYGQSMPSGGTYDSFSDGQQYSSDLNGTNQGMPYDSGLLMNGNLDGDVLNAEQEYNMQQQALQKPTFSTYQAPYQSPPQQITTAPLVTSPVQGAPLVTGASNQFTKMVADPANAAGNVQVALRDNNPQTHLAFAQSFVDKNYAATTKAPLEKSGITLIGDGKFLYAKVGVAQTKLNITPEGMQMLRATMDYAAEYNRAQTVKTIINAGIFQ